MTVRAETQIIDNPYRSTTTGDEPVRDFKVRCDVTGLTKGEAIYIQEQISKCLSFVIIR